MLNTKLQQKKFPKATQYRQNVGLILLKDKKIWCGHRIGIIDGKDTKSWQMPQGGIDKNETTEQAGYRELYEETGITKSNVELIAIMNEKLKYNFNEEVLKKYINTDYNIYCGQEQQWILFNFLGKDKDINLKPTEEPQEFDMWKWDTQEFLLSHCIDFKQNTYKLVFQWLNKVIS